MNVLILGEMTHMTKQMVKRLVEGGHNLRYQSIDRDIDTAVRIDSVETDWSIRGATVYPHSHIGGNHMTLQMAALQLQTKNASKAKGKSGYV